MTEPNPVNIANGLANIRAALESLNRLDDNGVYVVRDVDVKAACVPLIIRGFNVIAQELGEQPFTMSLKDDPDLESSPKGGC